MQFLQLDDDSLLAFCDRLPLHELLRFGHICTRLHDISQRALRSRDSVILLLGLVPEWSLKRINQSRLVIPYSHEIMCDLAPPPEDSDEEPREIPLFGSAIKHEPTSNCG